MYLLLVSLLIACIFRKNGGHFIYVLDDPYIHLALAENLARGHYGINLNEFASPSSSVLWPFLLIPLAGGRFQVYLPLLWNVLSGGTAAYLIGRTVERWPSPGHGAGCMPLGQQRLIAGLMLFAANLTGLTLIGMEHTLQVLLAICCAIGVLEAFSDRPIPGWCVAAAVVAPSVRYEDLALTLAVAIALLGQRSWRKAVGMCALSLVPLAAFSFYLTSKGLPALPLSVLIKGNAVANQSAILTLALTIQKNIVLAFTDVERIPTLILCLVSFELAWTSPTRMRRSVLAGAAVLGSLEILIGPFGWMGRYEVYAVIFMALLCVRTLLERPKVRFKFIALGLMMCTLPYILTTALSVNSASGIYRQQYETHRFLTEFYDGDYAVNDLGLASFQRRPGTNVLDLAGLGSLEAALQTNKSPQWIAEIVNRHHIALAVLYPEWFDVPHAWIPAGKMCLKGRSIGVAEQCVVFYSTTYDPEHEASLRNELHAFARTLPRGVEMFEGEQTGDQQRWVLMAPAKAESFW